MNYPLRHLSIRVPWHDTGWDGRVCAAPRLNGACLKLNRTAENRNDAAEEAVAGKSLSELPMPGLNLEALDFRAASESFAPHRKRARRGLVREIGTGPQDPRRRYFQAERGPA